MVAAKVLQSGSSSQQSDTPEAGQRRRCHQMSRNRGWMMFHVVLGLFCANWIKATGGSSSYKQGLGFCVGCRTARNRDTKGTQTKMSHGE